MCLVAHFLSAAPPKGAAVRGQICVDCLSANLGSTASEPFRSDLSASRHHPKSVPTSTLPLAPSRGTRRLSRINDRQSVWRAALAATRPKVCLVAHFLTAAPAQYTMVKKRALA